MGLAAARELAVALLDASNRVRASSWPPSPEVALRHPGLYGWWVDADGARQLSNGLGIPIGSGLIYAGQAGAGTSSATLASRIGRNHLHGNIRGSTFRWTLAAILRQELALAARHGRVLEPDSEQRLTIWMLDHLAVTPISVPDRIMLARLEGELLLLIDPPLNLRGVPTSGIRQQLSHLRAALGRES